MLLFPGRSGSFGLIIPPGLVRGTFRSLQRRGRLQSPRWDRHSAIRPDGAGRAKSRPGAISRRKDNRCITPARKILTLARRASEGGQCRRGRPSLARRANVRIFRAGVITRWVGHQGESIVRKTSWLFLGGVFLLLT